MEKDNVALTPPMGWNSWDCYGPAVNEEQLLGNAQYMAGHLKEYGWEYVCCDIQWSEPTAGKVSPYYVPFAWLTLDEYGRQLPAVERFPSAAGGKGFGPIAEKIHNMGLKFGIHIMRGIPRAAAHRHLPIHGAVGVTAADLADPGSICRWNPDMYGVRADHPAAQHYYDDLIAQYAGWGVGFIKCDDIANTNAYPQDPYSAAHEVEMLHNAILRSGRPIVLSLSPGPALVEKSWHYARNANMWRITDDLWDKWPDVAAMFERCELWCDHVAPGSYPDCDMLPLGRIGRGFGRERDTELTRDEQRTLVSLWCLFGSPLMVGAELTRLDDWTRSLLTNRRLLALLDPTARRCQLYRTAEGAAWVWAGTDEAGAPARVAALFNLAGEARTMTADLAEAPCLTGAPAPAGAEELWGEGPAALSGRCLRAPVPAHGVRIYKLS